MSLQKQMVSIPMSLGIDTENSPPIIENDRFSALSNVVFNKDSKGQLHKRSGHTALSRSIQGGGILPTAEFLEVFNDELGAVCSDENLYAYSSTSQAWTKRGYLPMVQQVETNIAAGAFSVQNPDAVLLNGIAYYAYEMNGSSWVKAVDDATKSVKATISLKAAIGVQTATPKILSNGSSIICLSVDSSGTASQGTLWGVIISPSNFSAAPTQLTTGLVPWFPTGANSAPEFIMDAAILGSSIYVACIVSSALKGFSYNAITLAAISNTTIAAILVAPAAVSVASWSTQVAVTWQAASGTFTMQAYTSSAWATGTGPISFGIGSSQAPRLATAAVSGAGIYGGSVQLAVFFEQPPAGANVLSAIQFYLILSGANSLGVFSTGTNIVGLPFIQGTNLYLPVVRPSTDQQTMFLIYQPATTTPLGLASVAGRYYSSNNAGAAPTNYRIPQNFGSFSLPVIVQPQGTSASTVSASLAELSLSFAINAQFSQLAGNQHIALGGQLYDYDGTNLVEHNFHLFPEAPVINNLASNLTVITDGYDPTDTGSGNHGVYRIAIPDNPVTPGGPAGQLITPGEYLTFYASNNLAIAPVIVYFVVNGNGTPPAAPGITNFTPCQITTAMNAIQIATALTAAMTSALTVDYVISYTITPQTTVWTPQFVGVAFFVASQQGAAPPMLNRVSTAEQVYVGSTVGPNFTAFVGISVPPASLISSGQYGSFTAPCNYFTELKARVYFWFANQNNPTIGNETIIPVDPSPFGVLPNKSSVIVPGYTVSYGSAGTSQNYIGIEVPLLGTELEGAVATKVVTALNALLSTAAFVFTGSPSAGQQGSEIQITYLPTVANQIVAADYPTTTIGQGYVGQVVDNVQGAVAIEYVSVYENIDSQNQLHESAPSEPTIGYAFTYTALGGGIVPAGSAVPISAVFQVSTLPLSLTLKTSANVGSNLDIAIYRTISGALPGNQVFYRVTPTNYPLFNQPTSLAAISYADYSSDIAVKSNQALYTTGGVLDNSAPPACSYVINHQNRLWLAGLENPNELWYSETLNDGFEVSFNNEQIVLVNPTVGQTVGGPIVALASMDSNLIILQENQIWYIQGSGPDPTGGNGFFSPPQIVASSSQIGCRDPDSVVLMPNGVMFKSTQGFWLLGRDLQLRYVGAAVKTFNSDIVSSAIALPGNSQINFLSESGTTLMYDWYYDSWSTFTTNGSDSLIGPDGGFTMVTASGAIWEQTEGMYYDGDGTPVTMSITTAWLKPSAVQGFGRVWKAFLEGYFYGSQPYTVAIAYNYVSTPVDNFTFNNGAGGTTIGLWGGSATWGEFIWGEDGTSLVSYADQIQLAVWPSNQPCESIQFTITDLPPVPVNNTWSLNMLDLELGVRKGGMKRLGNPQRLG
jgi:hypothetical protein